MTEFTAKSGAKVVINLAPWGDAKALKAAIEREASSSGLKLDANADAASLIASILHIDSSDFVDRAIWPCLARCTRNDAKIIPATFDSADARQDYYEIVSQCLMENFRPLVEGLMNVLPPSLMALVRTTTPKSDTPKQA